MERRELRIASETRNLSLVRQATAEVLGRSAFERADRDKIILAVDEAVANVVEHAYRGAPGEIEIDLALDERRLIVTIRDNGPPFDPRGVPAPDLREHVKQGLKGGFGLVLMRKIMDEVRWSLGARCTNELVLTKNVPRE